MQWAIVEIVSCDYDNQMSQFEKKKKIIGAIQLMPPQLQWVSITKKTVNCNQLQRSNDNNKWIRNK